MGLIKSKSLSSGVTGQYWRIVQKNMNYDRMDCVVTLALYLDKESRDADKSPIDSIQIDLEKEYHDTVSENTEDTNKNISLATTYKLLKSKSNAEAQKEEKNETLAFFADAVDEK